MQSLYLYKRSPVAKKIFFAMLVPTILMNLTTALASFADTVIIGYFLDDLSLSVVTFTTPIYMIINTCAALFAVGGSISMGIDAGKGDKASANKAFSMAVELLIIAGVIMLLTGVFAGKDIPALLGAGSDVDALVYEYLIIIMLGAPVFMLNIGCAFFVRNDGRPALSMAGMLISIVVNIVFDIIFIGPMDLGVAGAAYATVLSQAVSLAIIASHFFSKKCTLRFRFTFKGGARIFKNGISTALHYIYQFLTTLVLNHVVVNMAGSAGVVVYTVVFNLYAIALALFEGLSQTVQPMVSVYYGEKSNKNIKNTLFYAFMMTFIIVGAVTAVLEIFPGVVPFIFGVADPMITAQSAEAVRVFSGSMVIMTMNVVIGYYLQSTEHSVMTSILVSMRCCVVFLASVFVLGRIFGLNGIWASYLAAEAISFGIYIIMNRITKKQLRAKGIDADMFLQDKKTERETLRMTCPITSDEKEAFSAYVFENADAVSPETKECMKEYISALFALRSGKKQRYLEVEINKKEQRVMIKDDLDHSQLKETFENIRQSQSVIEYGPVLGWNRLCLKMR